MRKAGMAGLKRGLLAGTIGLAWCVWPVGVAAAQSEDAPLAGPKVESRDLPGVREEYVPSETGRALGAAQRVPLEAFLQALRELHSEETPAELRLTPEQAAEIREEVRRFGKEMSGFVETHRESMREMLTALPEGERGRATGELRNVARFAEVLDRVERGGGVFGAGVFGERRDAARRSRASGEDAPEPRGDAPAPRGDAPGPRNEEEDSGFRLEFDSGPGDMMGDEGMAAMDAMGDAGMMMNEDGTPDVRARVLALRAAAPSIAGLQTRVWSLLSPGQREAFGVSLDEYLAERMKILSAQRLEREAERREAERLRNGSDLTPNETSPRRAPGAEAFEPSDAMIDRVLRAIEMGDIPQRVWDRLPEQVRARLSGLPEEERAPALARWLQERRKPRGDG